MKVCGAFRNNLAHLTGADLAEPVGPQRFQRSEPSSFTTEQDALVHELARRGIDAERGDFSPRGIAERHDRGTARHHMRPLGWSSSNHRDQVFRQPAALGAHVMYE